MGGFRYSAGQVTMVRCKAWPTTHLCLFYLLAAVSASCCMCVCVCMCALFIEDRQYWRAVVTKRYYSHRPGCRRAGLETATETAMATVHPWPPSSPVRRRRPPTHYSTFPRRPRPVEDLSGRLDRRRRLPVVDHLGFRRHTAVPRRRRTTTADVLLRSTPGYLPDFPLCRYSAFPLGIYNIMWKLSAESW